MATSSVKKKKFSLTTLFTITLAVLPEVLTILNDTNETVYVKLDGNPNNGNIKVSVAKESEDGRALVPIKLN